MCRKVREMCTLLPFQPDFSEETLHVHKRVFDALVCVSLTNDGLSTSVIIIDMGATFSKLLYF